jgi:Flp pilus assembly protein TadG
MIHATRKLRAQPRRGVAAVELAILLPFLAFIFMAAIDFGRIFYYSQVVDNCARQGALYLSDPNGAAANLYPTVQAAALADATGLNPQPSVSSSTGTDASGNPFVAVTVTWQFQTIANYPGIPSSTNLTRTVQMRQVQN